MLNTVIHGRAFTVGDDINTDYIIPAQYLDLYEPEELAGHAFEGLGIEQMAWFKGCNVVVAGENFGLGSAREQAPNALKGAGVKAIIAKSFARIFFRNALNVGIAVIQCPEAVDIISQGEPLEINLALGEIAVAGESHRFPIFSGPVLEILAAGGMVPLLKERLKLNEVRKL